MANAFLKTLAAGSAGLPMGQTIAGGRGGGGFSRSWMLGGLLPGAKINYQQKAGDRWKNAVIAASLSWIGRNAPQAPPVIWAEGADGEESVVPKHPLSEKLRSPNPYYDGKLLRQATFLSLITGGGNAYWWVKRDNIGRALEIWWLPHWECWPLWDKASTTENWITGYAYRSNGITYVLDESEVIHFRDGMDPENMRLGLDSLRPASREIVTDNDAAGYTAALLGNMCIPGAIISPSGEGSFEDSDALEIKSNFEEAAGGDNRFRPMVLSGGVQVDKISFSPEEMALPTIQDRGEARLCAIIGINAVVLGLTVGLEHSTYNNQKEARAAAWEDGIIPRLELIHSTLDTQLLAYYPGNAGLRVGADYRRVPALQDNLDDKCARLSLAVGGPWMTPNEARAQLQLKDTPEGDALYPPPSKAAPKEDNPDAAPDAKPVAASGNGTGKAAESKGTLAKIIGSQIAELWRQ